MGKPLMLQEADAEGIESLKKRLRARTKIEIVRSALEPRHPTDGVPRSRIAEYRGAAE